MHCMSYVAIKCFPSTCILFVSRLPKIKKKLAYFRINGRRIPIHGVCVGELCSPARYEYQIDCYYSTLLTLLGTQNFKTTELTLSPFKPDLYTKGSF